MHDTVVTNVKTSGSITSEFPFTINFLSRIGLSSYLFALVMDESTRSIQDKFSWYMFFANDMVLVNETRHEVNIKLKV